MARDNIFEPQLSRRCFLASAVAAGAACSAGAWGDEPRKAATGTGFVYDPRYLTHQMGEGHPESPERLKAILARVKEAGLDKDLTEIEPGIDPDEAILRVHPERHIQLVRRRPKDDGICRLAVSGALAAVDAVCGGSVRNAFCAIRPPGHHAEDKGEYGFCFYNNVAIAARYAQRKYKIKRVLIVDWDYHHGNGTQWAFYDDPSVLFFSTHDLNAFPGPSGRASKKGEGDGLGFNINVPMPVGTTDEQILKTFEEKLLPTAQRFKPELILISAGFDSRKDDLLGRFKVTDDGFVRLTKILMTLASAHSQSRIVSLLEGGYNTSGLALAVEHHLRTLLGP